MGNIVKPWRHGLLLALGMACFGAQAQTLVVSAAASLKPAFSALCKQFEQDNPGVQVITNFAGSSQLASQIEQGARVHVFASADRRTMTQLSDKGLMAETATLAHGQLTGIAFKKAAGAAPTLDYLARPGTKVIMPSPKIPAAGYVAEFLKKADAQGLGAGQYSAKVKQNAVSQEPDIRMVVMKVALGEGDAGIVYATDITPDVKDALVEIKIPDELNVRAEYVIGLVKGDKDADAAKRFYRYALSPKGKALLASFRFGVD